MKNETILKEPPLPLEALSNQQNNNSNNPPNVVDFKLPSTQSENKTDAEQDGGSQRDKVIRLVLDSGCELFHNKEHNTFVTVQINGHKENWKLNSEGFKNYILFTWYQKYGSGLAAAVVPDAVSTLSALAKHNGAEHETHLRVANHQGSIYVDLCNDNWTAVCITPDGWSVVSEPPVKFIRTKGMEAMQNPLKGGSVELLRPLINAPTEDIWKLVVAWLLAAFSSGPYPILIVLGEQGAAKSFLCRILRMFIDPSSVAVTSSPKEERDVIIAGANSHVCAFDNLSNIPVKLSDLFCSIATGNAHRERKYHTNNGDEELFQAKRPILINGIDFSVRDDLLSRGLLVNLPTIPDDARRDEEELNKEISRLSPLILGGIFDVLASILKQLPTTTVEKKPRMADFAKWITAAEGSLGWDAGEFMEIYAGNRNEAVELAIDSDSFGSALRDAMLTRGSEWKVGWSELLAALKGEDKVVGWPSNPKAGAIRLKRLAPALRHYGIEWSKCRKDNSNLYIFRRTDIG